MKKLLFPSLVISIITIALIPAFSKIKLVPEYKSYRVGYDEATNSEVLQEVRNYSNGDIIEFQIKYRNDGDEKSKNFIIIGTIPENGEFIEGTDSISNYAKPLFSIDGGKTYTSPPVTYGANKIATPDMYTHIRWDIGEGLDYGKSLTAKYRVKIIK